VGKDLDRGDALAPPLIPLPRVLVLFQYVLLLFQDALSRVRRTSSFSFQKNLAVSVKKQSLTRIVEFGIMGPKFRVAEQTFRFWVNLQPMDFNLMGPNFSLMGEPTKQAVLSRFPRE
jgi:hypothetical protein